MSLPLDTYDILGVSVALTFDRKFPSQILMAEPNPFYFDYVWLLLFVFVAPSLSRWLCVMTISSSLFPYPFSCFHHCICSLLLGFTILLLETILLSLICPVMLSWVSKSGPGHTFDLYLLSLLSYAILFVVIVLTFAGTGIVYSEIPCNQPWLWLMSSLIYLVCLLFVKWSDSSAFGLLLIVW